MTGTSIRDGNIWDCHMSAQTGVAVLVSGFYSIYDYQPVKNWNLCFTKYLVASAVSDLLDGEVGFLNLSKQKIRNFVFVNKY
jgi:hypothetical protein